MTTSSHNEAIFHRLLVGTDGSAQAHDAVALAALIGAAAGAEVALLDVYPMAMFPGMTDRRAEQRRAEKLVEYERHRWHMAARVHTASDFSVPRALSRHAEEWKAELIVVGPGVNTAQGHTSISPRCRQLLGAGRFGLAIASRGLADGDPRLRTIGVGYDGGPESQLALDVAAGLARAAGAQLKIISVIDDKLPVLSTSQWMTLTDADLQSMWEAQRQRAAEEDAQAAKARGVSAAIEAVRGDPARRLRDFSQHVDLLVIGSRRWGTLARVLAGSVGEALVADCESSLLMVPRPARSPGRHKESRSAQEPVAPHGR